MLFRSQFLEPLLQENKWCGNTTRVVIEARRVWVVGRKFGLSLNITDMATKLNSSSGRREAFTDDDDALDALRALGCA